MLLLGLLSVLFIVLLLIFLLVYWGFDYSKTFSQHAARSKSSILYYFFVFFFFLLAFSVFMLNWFIPKIELSELFGYVFVLGVTGQLIAVIIPEVGGRNTFVHQCAAGVMAVSVFIQTIIVTFAVESSVSRMVGFAAVAIMISIILVLLLNLGTKKHILILQSAYFFSYLLLIAVVSVMV